MHSDPIFYELFQAAPQTFFELMQITPPCAYRFESITVKTTEKRIDGLLQPVQTGQPLYFVEVQGYPDEAIYWRVLREVATYFEQNSARRKDEWQAVVIWLDKENDDPEFGKTTIYDDASQQRIISLDLLKAARQLDDTTLAHTMLSPLLAKTEIEVQQKLPQWAATIQRSQVDIETEQRLLMLLTQIIEQKFKTLSYKELERMLKLTPFEETRSFVETHERKMKEKQIEWIVTFIQKRFKFAESTVSRLKQRLTQLSLSDLDPLFSDLIDMQRLRDINAWIDARLEAQNTQPSQIKEQPYEYRTS